MVGKWYNMYNILECLRNFKFSLQKDTYDIYDNKIAFLNFYGGDWFKKFVEINFPNKKIYNICFTSVNGKRTNLNKYKGTKIFWSGENIEPVVNHELLQISSKEGIYKWFIRLQKLYGDYRHNEVSLCMGYGNNEDIYNNYIRFPLWIIYYFRPEYNYKQIKDVIGEINNSKSVCLKDAVCMNKHDVFGLRSKICDDLSDILNISYPGKWRHNDDELWKKYDDNKLKYLNVFKFNICAENMDVPFYCTEKIFDSVAGGCIPVYAGCENNPEPHCLNRDFIIFWDLDDKYNTENKRLIKKLLNDDNFYYKFMKQKKLKDETADYVMDRFELLKKNIQELL